MSVVVRMEMPRDGLCDLAFSFLDGTFCTIEGNRCNYCDDGAIPKWCPIICSLPEGHGDLINREYAIATACSGLVRTLQTDEGGEKWIRVHEVRESIKSAPTIVPAERSET